MSDIKNSKWWTKKEIKLVKELRKHHLVNEIYDVLKQHGFERTIEAIASKCKREDWKFEGKEPKEDTILDEKTTTEKDSLLGQLENAWTQIVSTCKDINPADEKHGLLNPEEKKTKIVCISDLHIPFHKEDLVLDILMKHKGADYLVVNGDLLDLYAVSVFTKHQNVPLLKEYAIALEYIKVFSKLYKNVILLDGNHERRLHKYLSKALNNTVVPMLSRPILERLANGEVYDNNGKLIGLTPFENVHYSRHCAWMCQIGGAVFVHPEMFLGNSSTGVLRTVTKFDHKHRTQLDYEAVVMGHVHHLGKYIRDGVLLIEQGCLCNSLEYEEEDPKGKYGLQTLGYATLELDNKGHVDFNNSGPIYCGFNPKKLGRKIEIGVK